MTESIESPTAADQSPATEASLGFPLKGTLRRSPFPKLVRQIAKTRSTGSLFLLNGNTKKVVFFEGGQPVSVRSNVLSECLGQILAREGLITQAQCDQTLESIRRTGKKQGELLVEMGILSEGNLRYGLEAQLRHKLYDIFGWDDGKYQYKPETKGDDYGLRFGTPAEGLILIALLETSDEARAREALDTHREKFPIVDPDEHLDLEIMPEERHLLASVDGSRSIDELLAATLEPPVPSLALLLYAAIQAGVAKLATSRRAVRPGPGKLDDGRERSDAELRPSYAARLTVTTYEDTPLPGELPKPPEPQVPDADDFAVDDHEHDHDHDHDDLVVSTVQPRESREVSSALVAAERDTPDETFDDLDLGELTSPTGTTAPPLVADAAESGFYERISFDDDEPPLIPGNEPPRFEARVITTAPAPAPVQPELAKPSVEPPSVPEPPSLEPPSVEPPSEPEPPSVPEPPSLEPAEPELEPADDLEELEELDELEELEELDDEAAPGSEDELAAAKLDDLGDIDEDLMIDGEAVDLAGDDELDDLPPLDAELPPEDEDATDADLDADADLALDAELPPEGDEDEMVGLDELDDIELEGGAAPAASQSRVEGPGAGEFGQGEVALAEGRWDEATAHFERAYEQGVDVAELHAMLAWSRFKASAEAPDMAEHALELLGYAEEMNQALAMVFAYRAAVLVTLGDRQNALDAAQRALDLDPYDELAIDVMDTLG
ncbi:tetratricopeptide repeat protein [Nannocystaceae bacterium ST9]